MPSISPENLKIRMLHAARDVVHQLQRLIGDRRILNGWARALELRTSLAETVPASAQQRAVGVAAGADASPRRRAHDRRLHDGVIRAGRRRIDRQSSALEPRRVLLMGPDERWTLLAKYMFEEAGYIVSTAAEQGQALRDTARLLPDVVVMQLTAGETLELPAQFADESAASIPVVVLTSMLTSVRVHSRGPVILLPDVTDILDTVAEAETLTAATPRVQRKLKRRLVALQELAQHYRADAEAPERLRLLIDRLQTAILAVTADGRCIAASEGATLLTGYSRTQLLTSVLRDGFAGGHTLDELWRTVLANRTYAGTTRITNRAGEGLTVHTAAVAEILPGIHVAAFATV